MRPYHILQIPNKIEKQLIARIAIYFLMSLTVLGISIYHIVTDHARIIFVVIGLLVGYGIGTVVARSRQIYWSKNAAKVFSRFDAVGAIILVVYLSFEYFRSRIVADFVATQSVIAVSFAILSGIMFGRVLGMNRKIMQIFEENEK